MQGLDRLSDQMRDLDRQRASWQGQLPRSTSTDLRRETRSLSTALRKPQVRGRWGELHLRRAVELAGLVDRCDFAEQVRLDDGARRPDLVVHLVGGRQVVVDAKVPLDAYLDATSTDDDDRARAAHCRGTPRQLRQPHRRLVGQAVLALAARDPGVRGAVRAGRVVPGRGARRPTAASSSTPPTRQVVLATPTTLIALLRTVAHGWSHEALADQAREIHRLGRDLHDRLGTLDGHLDQVGRSLNAAVGHYNQAVGSLESRVLVAARRFTRAVGGRRRAASAAPGRGRRPLRAGADASSGASPPASE